MEPRAVKKSRSGTQAHKVSVVRKTLWLIGAAASFPLVAVGLLSIIFTSGFGGDELGPILLLIAAFGLIAALAATFRSTFPDRWPRS